MVTLFHHSKTWRTKGRSGALGAHANAPWWCSGEADPATGLSATSLAPLNALETLCDNFKTLQTGGERKKSAGVFCCTFGRYDWSDFDFVFTLCESWTASCASRELKTKLRLSEEARNYIGSVGILISGHVRVPIVADPSLYDNEWSVSSLNMETPCSFLIIFKLF